MSGGSFDKPKAKAQHYSRKFTNAVRPNEDGGYTEKKPLPRFADEEAADDLADASDEEVLEQATALHDCKYIKF
jgi:hypothetical protein